jgi:REP element-mobilizing transposase RayT
MPGRLRRHNESGHVHFVTVSTFRRLQFFRHVPVRDAFVDAMRSVRAKYPIRWLGYVVMPEHVHLLVLPQASADAVPTPISDILQRLILLRYFLGQ